MKKILCVIFVVSVSIFFQSCEDSLGIEENYSKKLIDGKNIEDISFKEYTYYSIDTITTISDSIIFDTTKIVIPIYDSATTYPKKGTIYPPTAMIYSDFDFFYYLSDISVTSSVIKIKYPYGEKSNITLLGLDLSIDFSDKFRSEQNQLSNLSPYKITLKVDDFKIAKYNLLYLSGDVNSNDYINFELIDNYGGTQSFSGSMSNSSFIIKDVIYAPDDNKRIIAISTELLFGYYKGNSNNIIWHFRMPMLIMCY